VRFKDLVITAISYLKKPSKRTLIKTSSELKNKTGIEIGGPSKFFSLKGGFPVYLFADKIDGVNFSTNTVWEGQINEGESYCYYEGKKGFQYITEATDLRAIPDSKYDFALSCHSLEHVANPIIALKEWNRISKKGAMFVLILPDKRYTFDHNRPYTSFDHLLDDYKKGIDEHDITHFEEIVTLHDRSRDPGMNTSLEVAEILKANYTNRMAHHHVFSQDLVKQMLEYCGFEVSYQQEMAPFHLITIAYKK
jgi:hypothetical protein